MITIQFNIFILIWFKSKILYFTPYVKNIMSLFKTRPKVKYHCLIFYIKNYACKSKGLDVFLD